jgi:hypothetical protein
MLRVARQTDTAANPERIEVPAFSMPRPNDLKPDNNTGAGIIRAITMIGAMITARSFMFFSLKSMTSSCRRRMVLRTAATALEIKLFPYFS